MKKPTLPPLSRIKKALYADWSLRVRSRDGFKCLLCGSTENITAHHWYCSDHHAHAARYSVDNGVTLCYACHIRGVHSRADYVSVERVKNALHFELWQMVEVDNLIEIELTTSILRQLWDGMRKRVIEAEDSYARCRSGKLYLYTKGNQIAVVGNVIRIPEGREFAGLNEVTVVTRTEDGYRYTLKQVEETE